MTTYPAFTCSKLTIKTIETPQKLTIKTLERRHWGRYGVFIINFEHGVFIVNFEHVSHLVLVFLLLALNM